MTGLSKKQRLTAAILLHLAIIGRLDCKGMDYASPYRGGVGIRMLWDVSPNKI